MTRKELFISFPDYMKVTEESILGDPAFDLRTFFSSKLTWEVDFRRGCFFELLGRRPHQAQPFIE